MKKKLIGVEHLRHDDLKPEYKNSKYLDDDIYLVSLYVYLTDDKYGVTIELLDWHRATEDMWKDIRKSQKGKKPIDWDKPFDTSKWPHPDRESIKNELIFKLACLHILDKKSPKFEYMDGQCEMVYSILYSHAPKNPQTLTDFGHPDCYLQRMLRQTKSEESKKADDILFDDKFGWDTRFANRWAWKFKTDKAMVKVDYKECSKKVKTRYKKSLELPEPTPEQIKKWKKDERKRKKEDTARIKKYDGIIEEMRKKHGRKR